MRLSLSLAVLALPVLAACVAPTQRDLCIRQNAGGGELSTIARLIRTTEGNINRGYAIAEVTDVATRRTRCERTRDDGTVYRTWCEETETVERTEPVAIDIAEERRKLADLRTRDAQLRPRYNAAVAQCTAQFPDVPA